MKIDEAMELIHRTIKHDNKKNQVDIKDIILKNSLTKDEYEDKKKESN